MMTLVDGGKAVHNYVRLINFWPTQKKMAYVWHAAYTTWQALRKLLIVSNHFAKFGGGTHCDSGDTMY